jgi:uncharacterized protein (DUF983 family)
MTARSGSAIRRGLRGRCPACGQGRLFDGLLQVRDHCTACGEPLGVLEQGDGPAVFVIMVVGALIVPLVVWLELAASPPLWVHVVLWAPLTLVLSLGLLRPAKGVILALSYQHRTNAP